MNLFDILGPVMVGPSSSHTAGAVRIGRIGRMLLGEGTPVSAKIELSGSFAATGQGHGTDRALIAGLLGMQPDDERIAVSFDAAKEKGMSFTFSRINLPAEHPNTARLTLHGKRGGDLVVTASSLGGGRIEVVEMNGLRAKFSGDLPTLIVQNEDKPGHVGEVATMLYQRGINLATMRLYRDFPGGSAVMIIETDKTVPKDGIDELLSKEGILSVKFIDAEG